MKAHKVVLFFVDHDEVGAEEAASILENMRYPNRCISPNVLEVKTVDIGEWSDDHPLNRNDAAAGEWQKLFPLTPGEPAPRAGVGLEIGESYEAEKGGIVTITNEGRNAKDMMCSQNGKYAWRKNGQPYESHYSSALKYGSLLREASPEALRLWSRLQAILEGR